MSAELRIRCVAARRGRDKAGAVRRALSAVDVLTMGVLTSLLTAILLPALGIMKEQSRIAVCLSNLRTIGAATNAYLMEFQDFSWGLPNPHFTGFPNGEYSFTLYTEFIWGGGLPDRSNIDWYEAGGGSRGPGGCDVWRISANARPMNRFVSPDVSWHDPRRDDSYGRRAYPMELPGVFKCPSDSTFQVPVVGGPNVDIEPLGGFATWEFWGSSYPVNWYWPYYYRDTPVGRAAPYSGSFLGILGSTRSGDSMVPGLGRLMVKEATGRSASRLILLMENRLNYALGEALPRGYGDPREKLDIPGWHRRANRHAAAFRDGSAAYMEMDTRYVNGPGWSLWPEHPWEGDWAPYDEQNP